MVEDYLGTKKKKKGGKRERMERDELGGEGNIAWVKSISHRINIYVAQRDHISGVEKEW